MSPFDGYTTTLAPNGRIVIPAQLRKELGFRDGETLSLSVEDGALKISSSRLAWQQLKQIVQNSGKAKTLSVDEFLKDRKEESIREGY